MEETGDAPQLSGSRTRTRRAILDAAIAVLSKDSAASLADIAAAAGVGRTTVHRHFAERTDLMLAISQEALARTEAAVIRARLDQGPAAQAFLRLCGEYFELGDTLMLLFGDPQIMQSPEWTEDSDADRQIRALIERGQAEGSIDPALSPTWLQVLIWSCLYAAWEVVRSGELSKHQALSLCLRTLEKAIVP